MNLLRIKSLLAASGVLLSVLIVTATPFVSAANVGNVAPYGNNSTPTDGHVFYLRSDSENGTQRKIELMVYIPQALGDSNWNNLRITLDPASQLYSQNGNNFNVCQIQYDSTARPNYVAVTTYEPGNPSNVRQYSIAHSGNATNTPVCQQKSGDNTPGSNGSNVMYASYQLPPSKPALDPDTGNRFYRVEMDIEFTSIVPKTAGGIRIRATASNNSIKIGQNGGGIRSFPLVGDWDIRDEDETSIRVPLGYCTGPTPQTVRLRFYDADNGSAFPGDTVSFRIWSITEKKYIDLGVDPPNGSDPGSNGTVSDSDPDPSVVAPRFTPTIGGSQAKLSYVNITLQKFYKYELRVQGVDPQNTVDIGLPFESIYGDTDICNDCSNCPTPHEDVIVGSSIYGGGEVEVGSTVTFTQAATVISENFPTGKEQGWNEMAVRRAVNTQTPPNQANYDANQGNEDAGASGQVQKLRLCAGGNYNPTCPNYRCQNGSTSPNGSTGCGNYNWRCEWTSPNGTVKVNNVGWAPPTPGCRIFQYQCRDASGNWTNNVFKDYNSNETTAETNYCTNRFNCPAPSGTPTFYNPSYGPGVCDIYYCAYAPGNLFYAGGNNPDGNCALRCDNGAGSAAPYHSEGDERCYKAAAFTVTCTWEDGNFTSGTVTDNVTIYCQNPPNLTKSQSVPELGRICATNNVTNSDWITNATYLPPGKGKGNDPNEYRKDWGIVINQSSEVCAKVGLKPYFHVYGGDVNATASFSPCTTPNATTVNSYNVGTSPNSSGGNFTGSGSQLAIFARGAISEFVSDSQDGPLPKSLTFGNTNAAGLPWGGNLSDLTCIPNDEWDKITAPAGSITIDLGFNDPDLTTVGPGANQKTAYVNGDVYITGPISYPQPFSLSDVPSLKIVTTGNIFIQGSIPEISGTFMAKQKIYTCAAYGGSGLIAPAPEQMAQVCRTPLKIYGSFIADQVKLLRTAGSRYYSVANPMSVLNSTDPGVPAELFLYTPDNWVRSLDGDTPGTPQSTQSILNLPPIL